MDKEFLHSELDRVSKWIESADKKVAFLSLYFAALIGYLSSNKEYLISQLSDSLSVSFIDVLILAILLAGVIGLYHLFFAIFPSLTTGNHSHSLFFFIHISSMSLQKYTSDMSSLTEDKAKEQLLEQIHTNSKIADKKMCHVRSATKLLFGFGFLVFLLSIVM